MSFLQVQIHKTVHNNLYLFSSMCILVTLLGCLVWKFHWPKKYAFTKQKCFKKKQWCLALLLYNDSIRNQYLWLFQDSTERDRNGSQPILDMWLHSACLRAVGLWSKILIKLFVYSLYQTKNISFKSKQSKHDFVELTKCGWTFSNSISWICSQEENKMTSNWWRGLILVITILSLYSKCLYSKSVQNVLINERSTTSFFLCGVLWSNKWW